MAEEQKLLRISSFTGQYAFLSNMYPCRVPYGPEIYRSSESAYQAAKTEDFRVHQEFAKYTGHEAKRIGRTIRLRPQWDKIKDDIMYHVVKAKFKYNKPLQYYLLQTGDVDLIEGNTWNDTYWGVCKGVGENKLGQILMRVREELKAL